jgi:hypothetical protein
VFAEVCDKLVSTNQEKIPAMWVSGSGAVREMLTIALTAGLLLV